MNVLSTGGSRVLAIKLEVVEMKNLELVTHGVVAKELALCHINLGSLGAGSGHSWDECRCMPGDDEQQHDQKLLVETGHYLVLKIYSISNSWYVLIL